jgi:hypothetical protein
MVQLNAKGFPYLPSTTLEETPYYMEAELNSPMAVLQPGEAYAFDTNWFPSRLNHDLATVTDAGLVGKPLVARRAGGNLDLSGSFGAFYPGVLKAFLYDEGGLKENEVTLQPVRPQDLIALHQSIAAAKNVARVSIHLIDSNGADRGALGEVFVTINDEGH